MRPCRVKTSTKCDAFGPQLTDRMQWPKRIANAMLTRSSQYANAMTHAKRRYRPYLAWAGWRCGGWSPEPMAEQFAARTGRPAKRNKAFRFLLNTASQVHVRQTKRKSADSDEDLMNRIEEEVFSDEEKQSGDSKVEQAAP